MCNQKDRLTIKQLLKMKKIILTLALGIATITFAQQSGMGKPGKMDPEQRKAAMQQKQQEHLDKMAKDLNLSPEQVTKVKALQDKQMSEMQANMEKNKEARNVKMAEMQKKREAHDAEMKKILSPEQYDKWQKQRLENMQKQRDAWKNKAMRKGGKQGGMKPQNIPH